VGELQCPATPMVGPASRVPIQVGRRAAAP
jgi:hypothetical protein